MNVNLPGCGIRKNFIIVKAARYFEEVLGAAAEKRLDIFTKYFTFIKLWITFHSAKWLWIKRSVSEINFQTCLQPHSRHKYHCAEETKDLIK